MKYSNPVKPLVIACAMALCISAGAAGLLPTSAAAKSAKTPLDRVEIVASTDAEGKTVIDVKASVSETMTLPATITIIAPELFKLENANSFNVSDPTKLTKIKYETGSDLEQAAYTFELTGDRAVALQFSGDTLTVTQSGHVVFGLGWTMLTDTHSVMIGTVVPENYIGSGPNIQLFGKDTSGNSIFGRTYTDVPAGTECVASMAFVAANPEGAGTGNDGQGGISKAEAEKAAAQKRTNTLIIMGVSALLLIAVIALIVVILKGRQPNTDDFDGPEDEDDTIFGDESEYEDDDDEIFAEEVHEDDAEIAEDELLGDEEYEDEDIEA